MVTLAGSWLSDSNAQLFWLDKDGTLHDTDYTQHGLYVADHPSLFGVPQKLVDATFKGARTDENFDFDAAAAVMCEEAFKRKWVRLLKVPWSKKIFLEGQELTRAQRTTVEDLWFDSEKAVDVVWYRWVSSNYGPAKDTVLYAAESTVSEAVTRLLEDCSDLSVRDEYWITPEGTLHANGDNSDYNHEGHVIEHVINLISDHFGLEWDGGPDGVAFRTMLNDEVFPERYGDDEEDPYQRMRDELVAGGVFRSQQEAEAATNTFGGNDDDARAFAINYWGWIRVAGPNIEVPDMSERTLKAAGEALADIVYEESGCDDMDAINAIPIRVSTYSGRRALGSGRREATIGELIAGESGAGNTELADIAKSGGDAVRKMDTALQNPYYKGRLGDSTSVRDVKGRLSEMADFATDKKTVRSTSGDLLKNMPAEQVSSNIVVFYNDKDTFFKPAGWVMIYFVDTDENAARLKRGEIVPLMFIQGSTSMRFGGYSMIDDIWKKRKRERWMTPDDIAKAEDQKHIVGALEAYVNDTDVYVDNVSVRPGWQRNSIGKRMMDALKHQWPDRKLTHSQTTSQGEKFLKQTGDYSPRTEALLGGVPARSLVEKFDVYEWHERVDRMKFKMLDQFLANPDGRWVLKRVPATLAKRIWLEYGKRDTISDTNGLDKIAEIMLDGIAALRVATQLQGHTDDGMGYHEMFNEVYDWDDEEMDQKVDPEKLYQFLTVQLDGEHDTMEFLSNYGLKPLERLVPQIADEEDPVKRLHALDRAFNICHQRSDLSAFFIEGGQSTLQAIADQGGYVAEAETNLPSDRASRMARAKELGFTVKAWHGTNSKFNEFDIERGKPRAVSGYAPHFADRRKEAAGYGSKVMPVLLRIRKPFYAEKSGERFKPLDADRYADIGGDERSVAYREQETYSFNDVVFNIGAKLWQSRSKESDWPHKEAWDEVYRRLRAKGYDAIIWCDVPADHDGGKYDKYTKITMLDASGIRLTSAMFDPARASDRDILA